MTASGVHDPESPGGAQGVPAGLGDLAGLEQDGKACEMIDGSAFNPDKAYKDSKVRNVGGHFCIVYHVHLTCLNSSFSCAPSSLCVSSSVVWTQRIVQKG